MRKVLMSTSLLIASTATAWAETIEIEMQNMNANGDRMVFSQELIRAEVGDVIRFVATDKSHNAQSVDGALPEGQEGFRGRVNQAVEYTVTKTGLTAVICLPHQAMGMVALVMVGDDVSNADAVLEARVAGKGGAKIEDLVAEARALVESDAPQADQNS